MSVNSHASSLVQQRFAKPSLAFRRRSVGRYIAQNAGYLTGPTSRHVVPVMPATAPIWKYGGGGQKAVTMQLTWGDRRSCGTGRHENSLLDVGRAGAGHIRWCNRSLRSIASSDQHHARRGAVKGRA
jgi:hypothetical protein